jgi:hypothetical protein
MRVLISTVGLLLATVTSSGCLFQNIGTAERLRDAVDGVNDSARWSRLDLAVQRVHPAYRTEYMKARHRWGRSIQIADSEVLNMRIAEGDDEAVSVVAVSWYSYDTMTLHQSVIRQEWKRLSGEYALHAEIVVDGDDYLLAPPPEESEDDAEA